MIEMQKRSLRNVDIVVPYREATVERRENLYAVLAHLSLTYTDYQLWLLEGAVTPHFDWTRLQDPNIRHVFVAHDGPFPKAMLCNMGVRLARSPVVCFHDADSITDPGTLRGCIDALLDGNESDALCPYLAVINVSGELKQSFMEMPVYARLASIDPQQLPHDANLLYSQANGGVVLFRRKEYLRVGGYDASLEGWGGEDNELFLRAVRLGVRWHSIPVPLFHLHHDSSVRSELINSLRDSENMRALQVIEGMSQKELEALARGLSEALSPP